MKFIGQHIYDFVARFRNNVYLEDVSTGTIASGGNLGLDSNNKIVKATAASGDIEGVTAGTGLSGGGTTGTVTLNVSGLTVSEIAAGSILVAGETFVDNDTSLMSAAAINDRIESFGYTTNTGDITSVSITTDSGSGDKAEDASGSAEFSILGATGVGVTNSGTTITATAVPGEIDHDSLLNFAANEHFTQANITTVGTIGTGVWQGDAINATYLAGQSGTNTGDETLASINALDITEVGTISSGVWQGTAIATAYIADDAVTEDKLANTLLAEIDANTAKATNVSTNLSQTNSFDSLRISSSDGTDVIIAEASGSIAGVMTVAHHDKLEGIENGATADQSKSDIDGLAITTVGTLDTGNATAIVDAASLTAAGKVELATTDEADTGTDATRAVTPAGLKSHVDAHARKSVLRCNAFYVNTTKMVQNNLYFGGTLGHQPYNWNDPAAVGGVIGDTASFTISNGDENWGMVLPFNISKIEVQCSLRPNLGTGDDLTVAIYTGVRSNDSSAALTLTKAAHNSVALSSTANRYTRNDVSVTADYDENTMIYVGVGTEDDTDMKQGRGYMTITVTER